MDFVPSNLYKMYAEADWRTYEDEIKAYEAKLRDNAATAASATTVVEKPNLPRTALDTKSGFIHMSTSKQAGKITTKIFPHERIVLVTLAFDRLRDRRDVRLEGNSRNEAFYHAYNLTLPCDAVDAIQLIYSDTFDFATLVW
jgi:uncharacterized protein (DUF952 family)